MLKDLVRKNEIIRSIFFSSNLYPLECWDKEVKNGHIRRLLDEDVKSLVLELSGTNVATTYITSPIKPRASLGIKLPFLVLIVKNMKKYFTFEIQILDDKNMRRRFRVSNFQSTTKVRPFCTTMPIGLSSGWNQIQFNLADFTRRAYGSTYVETMRIQVHANVRIRRIYFADRLYSDDEMPAEFKMFLPFGGKKGGKKEEEKPKAEVKADKPAEEKPPEGVEEIQVEAEAEPSGAPPTPVGEEEAAPKEGVEGGEEVPEAPPAEEGVEEVAIGEPDVVEGEEKPPEAAPEEAAGAEPPPAEGGEPVSEVTEDMAAPANTEGTDAPTEAPTDTTEVTEPTE